MFHSSSLHKIDPSYSTPRLRDGFCFNGDGAPFSVSEIDEPEKRLEALREAIALLAPSHSETLQYLMVHLKRYA